MVSVPALGGAFAATPPGGSATAPLSLTRAGAVPVPRLSLPRHAANCSNDRSAAKGSSRLAEVS